MAHKLAGLLTEKKIIIMLGAGGVGKTSCTIALAIAAARLGLKVGLLSIDPAKRLAQAMGLELGAELKRVVFPESEAISGSLDACMLDQKTVFDRMVHRFSPNPTVEQKILNHKLYISASTNISGSLEYMALAKLQEMVAEAKYDLIILDTPPDSHALDFLKRPNILAGFMEQKVMNWLIKPFHLASRLGFDKIMNVGERLMGGMAQVTGFATLKIFAEFLILIQDVINGFHKVGQSILATLQKETTGFILVTSPSTPAMRSAKNMAKELPPPWV